MWKAVALLVCIGIGGDLYALDGKIMTAAAKGIKDASATATHYMTRRL
jgi:hypothetical protein